MLWKSFIDLQIVVLICGFNLDSGFNFSVKMREDAFGNAKF